jgi:hypothetical protein
MGKDWTWNEQQIAIKPNQPESLAALWIRNN